MDHNESRRAKVWLDTLGHLDDVQPNLLDEGTQQAESRAWSMELDGQYFVYFEHTQRDVKTKFWVGALAVSETIGLDEAQLREAQLGAARSYFGDNNRARTALAQLIGVRYNALDTPALAIRTEDEAKASHFYEELNRLSGLSVEESSALNLAVFSREPLGGSGNRWTYLLGVKPLGSGDRDGVPALGFNNLHRLWRIKFFDEHKLSGLWGRSEELIDFMNNQADWLPADTTDVKTLTASMAEQNQRTDFL